MTAAIDFRPVILAGGSGTRFWPRRPARTRQTGAGAGRRADHDPADLDRLTAPDRLNAPCGSPNDVVVITNRAFSLGRSAHSWMPCPAAGWFAEPAAAIRLRRAAGGIFLIERLVPRQCWGSFRRSRDRRRSRFRCDHPARDSVWRPQATTSSCWASSPRVRRRATATSKRALPATMACCACGGLPRSESRAGGGVSGRGQLFLEQRHVRMERAHPGQRRSRAAAGNGSSAGADRGGLDTPEFDRVFRRAVPKCENISVDYAILERARPKASIILICTAFRALWLERPGFVGGAA